MKDVAIANPALRMNAVDQAADHAGFLDGFHEHDLLMGHVRLRLPLGKNPTVSGRCGDEDDMRSALLDQVRQGADLIIRPERGRQSVGGQGKIAYSGGLKSDAALSLGNSTVAMQRGDSDPS
jgi:hypothetical protein